MSERRSRQDVLIHAEEVAWVELAFHQSEPFVLLRSVQVADPPATAAAEYLMIPCGRILRPNGCTCADRSRLPQSTMAAPRDAQLRRGFPHSFSRWFRAEQNWISLLAAAYVSLVGFRFLNTRVLGVSIPFHRDFDEVNLRFYVRRNIGSEVRRESSSFVRSFPGAPSRPSHVGCITKTMSRCPCGMRSRQDA